MTDLVGRKQRRPALTQLATEHIPMALPKSDKTATAAPCSNSVATTSGKAAKYMQQAPLSSIGNKLDTLKSMR